MVFGVPRRAQQREQASLHVTIPGLGSYDMILPTLWFHIVEADAACIVTHTCEKKYFSMLDEVQLLGFRSNSRVALNGTKCRLTERCSYRRKQRVLVRINHSVLSVAFENIHPCAMEYESCCICLEPLYKGTLHTFTCGHTLHWWCADEWRRTAGFDLTAAGAHCPVCRVYTGIRLFPERPLYLFDYSAQHIFDQALKFIVSRYYRQSSTTETIYNNIAKVHLERIYAQLDDMLDAVVLPTSSLLLCIIDGLRMHVLLGDEVGFPYYSRAVSEWVCEYDDK